MGKSELAAAVALLTCGDGEERAEVYGCAADRNQATIVFDVAAIWCGCARRLKRVKILASQKRLIYEPTNSFYQVLSADVANKHGFNTHGVVFDELHTQPNRKLFDVMTKGSGDARMQPLYFLITTAGKRYELHLLGSPPERQDILDGRKFDPTFYPVIYGADMRRTGQTRRSGRRQIPSLGITVGIDKVRSRLRVGKAESRRGERLPAAPLNQWVKQAVAGCRWRNGTPALSRLK
jgi:phage terminase large subunit-like protein